jgi:hypothetical protein
MIDKYNPSQIKGLLQDVNTILDNEIKELIKEERIDYSRKIREIKNKNIETLLLIHELEYKGVL